MSLAVSSVVMQVCLLHKSLHIQSQHLVANSNLAFNFMIETNVAFLHEISGL